MFFRRLPWNVVGWYRTVSAISIAIIAAGAAMIVFNLVVHHYPIKLGLSFTGGSDVTVKYAAPATPQAIVAALHANGIADPQVNTLTKASDAAPNERFTITTQTDVGNDTPKLWHALGTVGTVDRRESQIQTVGPSLSHEYLFAAVEALVIAIGIQFLYIAFRFGWNYIFGLVTVIALLRDAGMMIGIYALAQKRADDAFLAAVLTVIGYSVMDTIVILDRIRENVKTMPGVKYDKIVNVSILQTMTRSLNTLATVVITLVALLAFGGASLQNFAFALLVGIVSGGYHSIFFSAPLVYYMRESQMKKAATDRAKQISLAGERPRTVAEARAQGVSATTMTREQIVEARRSRRERDKLANARATSSQPIRYKKKRSSSALPGATATPLLDEDEGDFEDHDAALGVEPGDARDFGERHDRDVYGNPLDPLDAQRSGWHDEQMELGHEEIVLDLGDEDGHDPAAVEIRTHGSPALPIEDRAARKD